MREYLTPGFGLEFEGGHHGSGIDLRDRAQHVELFELRFDLDGDFFQFLAVESAAGRWFLKQSR